MSGFWAWLRTALAFLLGARTGAAQERQAEETATIKEDLNVAQAVIHADVPRNRGGTVEWLRTGKF